MWTEIKQFDVLIDYYEKQTTSFSNILVVLLI